MLLLVALGLSTLVFYPILYNYFFGDDLYFIFQIINAPLQTFLFAPYGGHLFVARNVVFVLCYRLFGSEPTGYFAVALATHLVNIVLLYRVIRLLTASPRLALFGAVLWGSAPLHEGTLGWYSAYGIAMVGTAALWLLHDLARAGRGQPLGARRLLLWPVWLFIAATGFGVGLAVVLVFPLIVLLMHPPRAGKTGAVLSSAAAAALLVAGYFFVHHFMLTAEGAAIATSTLTMSTLTNVGPLLGWIRDLTGFGLYTAFLREAAVRLPYSTAAGNLSIAVLAGVLLLGCWRGNRQTRGTIVACVAMALAIFAAVAAGRGPLWGEKFYIATRYQYVPLVGIVIALCCALAAMDTWRSTSRLAKNAALTLWIGAILALHFTLSPGIDHHEKARRATNIEITEMRRLIRSTPQGQDVRIQNQVFHGVGPMMIRNPKMFPGWAAAFTIFFPDNVVEGRRVFFVEADSEVRDATRSGKRTATLIVPP